MKAERGIVLVVVLWMVALLSVLAASLAVVVRTETLQSSQLLDQTRARAVARAALAEAMRALSARDPQWPDDATPLDWSDGEVLVTLSIQASSGLIDLNTASEERIAALLMTLGDPPELARQRAAILADAVDADDQLRPGGAEQRDYQQAGLWPPPNRPLESIEQLRGLPGFAQDVVERLQPWVTVWSGLPDADAARAPWPVIAAFGVAVEQAQHYVFERQQAHLTGRPPPAAPAAGSVTGGDPTLYHVTLDVRQGEAQVWRFLAAVRWELQSTSAQPYRLVAWQEGGILPQTMPPGEQRQ